ncbi:hypothetical protein [Cystobacter fuscus]|uniref:hypothetical protein n=1 Tax=Cystobacter fuscus TaxID=43 RepID=UPI002B2BD31A|nr:hypothetical protein F0U63_22640 [Cystobacter fuscus]
MDVKRPSPKHPAHQSTRNGQSDPVQRGGSSQRTRHPAAPNDSSTASGAHNEPPSTFSRPTHNTGPTLHPRQPHHVHTAGPQAASFYGRAQPSPYHEQIVNNASLKISEQPHKFRLEYNEQELSQLTSHGHKLGIPPRDVENLIYVGSRNDKRISARELQAQMTEHAHVMERGYPHLFHDKAQFRQFSNDLIRGVRDAGFPHRNVEIQGSSLRTPNAGDIDIAVMANKEQFAAALMRNYDKKMTFNGQKISLEGKDFRYMKDLAKDIMSTPGYNSKAKTFANAILTGIMHSSSSSNKELRDLAKTLSANYKEPVSPKDPTGQKVESISLVLEGGKFDISPSMTVKYRG